MHLPRRTFLRYASLAAAGQLAGLNPFGALNAMAQATSGYKALVCIYLVGGNDTNNLLIPYDTTGYANYAKLRGPLSLDQNTLLPLQGSPNFALCPQLPGLQSLFDSKQAAIVQNVGTLVKPITRQEYLGGTAVTPDHLFSHTDQAAIWQNAEQGSKTISGWGGRLADAIRGGNSVGKYPILTSLSGSQVFCNADSSGYATVTDGIGGKPFCGEGPQCATRFQTSQQMLTFNSGISLIQADDQITSSAYNYGEVLQDALSSGTPIKTSFGTDGLSAQLKEIAQIIQVRSALGTEKQIFFASLGGFDTHSNQLGAHELLLTQLGEAMSSFYQATEELGLSSQITTFTMSDFGRTMQPNSATGSDHAWGSHQIVLGGAVKGGQLYGTYPTLALAGPDDASTNGRWIPTSSVSQYAATLASWFGVSATDLPIVLPLLGNFSNQNLGFI